MCGWWYVLGVVGRGDKMIECAAEPVPTCLAYCGEFATAKSDYCDLSSAHPLLLSCGVQKSVAVGRDRREKSLCWLP